MVVAQVEFSRTDGLSVSGRIHGQHAHPPAGEVFRAHDVLNFLGNIETIERNHNGRFSFFRVLRVDKDAGKRLFALEGNFHVLDARGIRERGEALEAVQRFTIRGVRRLVLGRPEPLAELVIKTRPLEECGGGEIVLLPRGGHA